MFKFYYDNVSNPIINRYIVSTVDCGRPVSAALQVVDAAQNECSDKSFGDLVSLSISSPIIYFLISF